MNAETSPHSRGDREGEGNGSGRVHVTGTDPDRSVEDRRLGDGAQGVSRYSDDRRSAQDGRLHRTGVGIGAAAATDRSAAAHATRVRSFSAAGDRCFVGYCDTCARNVGSQTTDRAKAQTDADAHTLAPIRGRV